jgi:ParB-like chromosome segregation protein Spo0J
MSCEKEIFIPLSRADALVPVEKLKPFEKNAKKHDKKQIELLKRLISEQGFLDPIEVRSETDFTIVCGHARLLAAKELGMKEVPVVFAGHLTDSQVLARRLSQNKSAESEWDKALLIESLHDLEMSDVDISFSGFETEELEKLLKGVEPPEVKDADIATEVDKIAHVRVECPSCGFIFKKKKEE